MGYRSWIIASEQTVCASYRIKSQNNRRQSSVAFNERAVLTHTRERARALSTAEAALHCGNAETYHCKTKMRFSWKEKKKRKGKEKEKWKSSPRWVGGVFSFSRTDRLTDNFLSRLQFATQCSKASAATCPTPTCEKFLEEERNEEFKRNWKIHIYLRLVKNNFGIFPLPLLLLLFPLPFESRIFFRFS